MVKKSIEVLKDLIKQSPDPVRAISFSGQMHSMVILDENDQILDPAILWNDQRTIHETNYLNEVVGQEQLIKMTGNMAGNIAVTGFTSSKILWMKNNQPNIFEKIAK